jgi:hypothetical protein
VAVFGAEAGNESGTASAARIAWILDDQVRAIGALGARQALMGVRHVLRYGVTTASRVGNPDAALDWLHEHVAEWLDEAGFGVDASRMTAETFGPIELGLAFVGVAGVLRDLVVRHEIDVEDVIGACALVAPFVGDAARAALWREIGEGIVREVLSPQQRRDPLVEVLRFFRTEGRLGVEGVAELRRLVSGMGYVVVERLGVKGVCLRLDEVLHGG